MDADRNEPPAGFMLDPTQLRTDDNWRGKTSADERRKIQNRLNQRTWRLREKLKRQGLDVKRLPATSQPLTTLEFTPSVISSMGRAAFIAQPQQSRVAGSQSAHGPRAVPPRETIFGAMAHFGRYRRAGDVTQADIEDLSRLFLYLSSNGGGGTRCLPHPALLPRTVPDPASDQHLLPLVQFNVFRGMLQNLALLGVDLATICADDTLSPFCPASPSSRPNAAATGVLPPCLRPSPLQLSTIHHPWIDFLPSAKMRDNVIIRASLPSSSSPSSLHTDTTAPKTNPDPNSTDNPEAEADGEEWDDEPLCSDIVGLCSEAASASTGLVCWGEPWDFRGWEVTGAFAAKWGWVVRECDELLEATNYWRGRRGEARLKF